MKTYHFDKVGNAIKFRVENEPYRALAISHFSDIDFDAVNNILTVKLKSGPALTIYLNSDTLILNGVAVTGGTPPADGSSLYDAVLAVASSSSASTTSSPMVLTSTGGSKAQLVLNDDYTVTVTPL